MPDRPEPAAPPPPVAPPPTVRVPLRRAQPPAAPAPVAVAPLRAVAGAALAVAAVSLGIGALLLVDDAPAAPPAGAAPAAVADPVAEPPAEPAAEPTPAATRSSEPATPRPAPPARPPLTVLNNSRIAGLAAREAAALRATGWDVAVVGNLRGRTRTSTVYYDAGQQAAAERLARTHDVPRVLPRHEGLPGRGLTLVVTRDRG